MMTKTFLPPKDERRIRILSVIDGLGFAGDERRLLNMSRGLDPQRFQHSVLTLRPADYGPLDEYQACRAQFIQAGVEVKSFEDDEPSRRNEADRRWGRFRGKAAILARARRLARTVRDYGVDIIDARLESAGLVGALAGKLSRTSTCVTLYGWHTPTNEVAWPAATRLAMRLTTSLITDSKIRADQMRALLGKHQSKVHLIPNGIERPHSSRSSAEMRKILGLPEDPRIRIIGQVARLAKYKGHEVLIRAAEKVLRHERDVIFLCVGFTRGETYKRELLALARQLGLADRLVITEYKGDIADIWKVLDIHVHASLFDSLPISIAEGMSLEKPAVVTDTGGIPEIVLNNETGLVVPAGDPDALSGALLQILRDPPLARKLGANAKMRYEHYYRPQTMIHALEQHFLSLAKS